MNTTDPGFNSPYCEDGEGEKVRLKTVAKIIE
jgi:hypothetical protein